MSILSHDPITSADVEAVAERLHFMLEVLASQVEKGTVPASAVAEQAAALYQANDYLTNYAAEIEYVDTVLDRLASDGKL